MTHPLPTRATFHAQLSRDDPERCPVCLEPLTQTFHTPCGHVLCRACARHWFGENDSCPTCREPVHSETYRRRGPTRIDPASFSSQIPPAATAAAAAAPPLRRRFSASSSEDDDQRFIERMIREGQRRGDHDIVENLQQQQHLLQHRPPSANHPPPPSLLHTPTSTPNPNRNNLPPNLYDQELPSYLARVRRRGWESHGPLLATSAPSSPSITSRPTTRPTPSQPPDEERRNLTGEAFHARRRRQSAAEAAAARFRSPVSPLSSASAGVRAGGDPRAARDRDGDGERQRDSVRRPTRGMPDHFHHQGQQQQQWQQGRREGGGLVAGMVGLNLDPGNGDRGGGGDDGGGSSRIQTRVSMGAGRDFVYDSTSAAALALAGSGRLGGGGGGEVVRVRASPGVGARIRVGGGGNGGGGGRSGRRGYDRERERERNSDRRTREWMDGVPWTEGEYSPYQFA